MLYPYVGYYSAIKKNKGLIYATGSIKLKNTILSEASQAPKVTYYMIPFVYNIQNKPMETDMDWWLPGAERGRKWE